MFAPLIFAWTFLPQQPQGEPPAPAAPQQPFAVAPAVAEPQRLALTPKLDGVLSPEEWDPFATVGGVQTFVQWEPRKVHVAAKLPLDRDLLVSIDPLNNGWLEGKDNLEVRVSLKDGKPVVKAQSLDGTDRQGPKWAAAPMFEETAACAAKAGESDWTVELTISDAGMNLFPRELGKAPSLRVDAVPAGAGFEPYLPRAMVRTPFVMERGSSVPGGLRWKPQYVSRVVAPGSTIRIRLTFEGAKELALERIDMQTEGLAHADTLTMGVPFPAFDNKGRAFVDYTTPVAPNAVEGFRVLRANVKDGSGQTATLRTCYEIAPLIEFAFNVPRKLKSSDKAQKFRFSVYAQSNSPNRVDGVFKVVGPEGWKIESGSDKAFIIYNSRGSIRRVFEADIPAGAKGVFPIRLMADVAGKTYTEVAWVTIP